MFYIECPERRTDLKNFETLFLAGGITDCRDWQADLAKRLKYTSLALLNPRRKQFDINDLSMMEEQIVWEYDHLAKADAISFWFERDVIQPIALFELGRWSAADKPIFVGCDPDYPRINDVLIQMNLIRPGFHVVNTLDALADKITHHFYGEAHVI